MPVHASLARTSLPARISADTPGRRIRRRLRPAENLNAAVTVLIVLVGLVLLACGVLGLGAALYGLYHCL
jgi:hypothetical protein